MGSRWTGGVSLLIEEGELALWLVDRDGLTRTFRSGAKIRESTWSFVAASVDLDWDESSWSSSPSSIIRSTIRAGSLFTLTSSSPIPCQEPLCSWRRSQERTGHFNGRIERPWIADRAVPGDELDAAASGQAGEPPVAVWDFSREISSSRIDDIGPHGLHGSLINQPTRAVRGVTWSGEEANWTHRPEEYSAIHFHDDDLDDCGWQTDFAFTIPADLPSGVYAARLRAGEDEDHLPFVVSPPPGTATAVVGN